jgi:hypothetical protein
MFRMAPEQARDFVESVPRIVKRRVLANQVEHYEAALREIGAVVELRRSPIQPARIIAVAGAPAAPVSSFGRQSGRTLTLPELPPALELAEEELTDWVEVETAPALAPVPVPVPPPVPASAPVPAPPPPPAWPSRPTPEEVALRIPEVLFSSSSMATQPGFVLPVRGAGRPPSAAPAAAPRSEPPPAFAWQAAPALELDDAAAQKPRPGTAAAAAANAHAERLLISAGAQGLELQVQPKSIPPAVRTASAASSERAPRPSARPSTSPRASGAPRVPGAVARLAPVVAEVGVVVAKPGVAAVRPAAVKSRPAPRPASLPAPPKPALGPLLLALVALALLIIGASLCVLVRGVRNAMQASSWGGSSAELARTPPSAAEDDARRAKEGPGAAVWAQSELHQFGNGDKDRVRSFLAVLEHAGARGVFPAAVARRGAAEIAGQLRVELPTNPAQRRAIYQALHDFHAPGWDAEFPAPEYDADPFPGHSFVLVPLG